MLKYTYEVGKKKKKTAMYVLWVFSDSLPRKQKWQNKTDCTELLPDLAMFIFHAIVWITEFLDTHIYTHT